MTVSAEHDRRFAEAKFFVLDEVVPPALEILRQVRGRLVDERNREMDRLGVDTLDLDASCTSVFHRSGPNTTDHMRRVHGPILRAAGPQRGRHTTPQRRRPAPHRRPAGWKNLTLALLSPWEQSSVRDA